VRATTSLLFSPGSQSVAPCYDLNASVLGRGLASVLGRGLASVLGRGLAGLVLISASVLGRGLGEAAVSPQNVKLKKIY